MSTTKVKTNLIHGDSCRTRQKSQRTEKEMIRDRLLANRRSAKQSRERRKALLANLQETVNELNEQNSALILDNKSLREKMTSLQIKCLQTRRLLSVYQYQQQHALLVNGGALLPPHHFSSQNILAAPQQTCDFKEDTVNDKLKDLSKDQLAILTARSLN